MQTSRKRCCGQIFERGVLLSVLGLSLMMISGCSRADEASAGRSATTVVSGKVTYRGAPVESATVVLIPESAGGKGASGLTDSRGRFTLTTYKRGDGAAAGNYRVTVTKLERQTSYEPDVDSPQYEGPPPVAPQKGKESGPKHLLPQKYSKDSTSGLTALVVSGKEIDDLNFDLVD